MGTPTAYSNTRIEVTLVFHKGGSAISIKWEKRGTPTAYSNIKKEIFFFIMSNTGKRSNTESGEKDNAKSDCM